MRADKANARVRFRPAPKRHAGHFTPVDSAGEANMSMSAINAMQNIRQAIVRSHLPTSAPISGNPDHNLLRQVLGSQPVTPVKVDRYEKLLVGYSPALKTLLVDGFRNGFRIYDIGEFSSFESPNLESARQSPDIVSAKLKQEIEAGKVV